MDGVGFTKSGLFTLLKDPAVHSVGDRKYINEAALVYQYQGNLWMCRAQWT